MTIFTVVSGGRSHEAAEPGTCPACAPGWPQPCDCGRGLLHAEEHPVRGGWGPAVSRYSCASCGALSPDEVAADRGLRGRRSA